ncbi:MAG: type IV pilus twitching motility protein PilT [Candidatus Cloacimonetes bacterium]|nr:type IV pilus twitching motility protein PilT [Candidatus Cloacimonadota bacterium]
MPLSFAEELRSQLDRGLTGLELCQAVDQIMQSNPKWSSETHDLLSGWLLDLKEKDASDLDFGAPGSLGKIWMRVQGEKYAVPSLGEYSHLETTAIIISWLNQAQKQKLYDDFVLDFSSFAGQGDARLRFRGTCYVDRGYLCVNFRRINDFVFSLQQLRMPKPIVERMSLKHEKIGLILVTGITGSGKSTTLDSVIDMNNSENRGHIVIIGDPIEYIHESRLCLVRHREVGVDVSSFAAGAIEALRQDPDIIIVGEMRDPKTISTVMEITDSGHKAFSTLHTSSAIDSIHRIIAEFPSEEQERVRSRLADVLSIIISQKLVPSVDNKRVMTREILSVDSSVQAAIRNKNIGEIYQMMVEGRRYGMCTLEQDLCDLYKKGTITHATAMNYANNKKRMHQLISVF